MSQWHTVSLGEVCEAYQPTTLTRKELRAGPFPVFGANGQIGTHDEFNHSEPELILGCRGSCGSVNVTPPNSWINGNAMVIRPNDELVSRRYLEYLLRGGLNLNPAIGGAAQPQITRKSLYELELQLPPVSEQDEIVARLDEVNDVVGGLSRNRAVKCELLDSIGAIAAQAVLSSATQFQVETLDALVERGVILLNRGKVISRKNLDEVPGDYPVYSSAKQNGGEFGRYGRYMFDEEAITWSIDGGGALFHRPKHKYSVTNVGGIMRIADKSALSYRYLFHVLRFQHSTSGFDWVKKAHPSVIRKVYDRIPLPPIDEQERIASLLDEIASEVARGKEAAVRQVDDATAFASSLMRELMAAPAS